MYFTSNCQKFFLTYSKTTGAMKITPSLFLLPILALLSCNFSTKEPLTRKQQLTLLMKKRDFSLTLRDKPFSLTEDTPLQESPQVEGIWNLKGAAVVDFNFKASGTGEFMIADYNVRNKTLHLTVENVGHPCMCEYELYYRLELKNTPENFDSVAFYFENYN